MTNAMLFAVAMLCWELGVYGYGSDPLGKTAQGEVPGGEALAPTKHTSQRLGWYGRVIARSAVAALLLAAATGFSRAGWMLGGCILIGALAVPELRRWAVGWSLLAEFEAAAQAGMTLVLWEICLHWPVETGSAWVLADFSVEKQAAVCFAVAILIFALRGGSLIVLGLLAKTGQLPEQLMVPQAAGRSHSASEMIGYVERVIVLLIVAAGNLQALAFFFVAKGLARSKKLEDDPKWANYFLLGSLVSFLVALMAGLILQQVMAALWK